MSGSVPGVSHLFLESIRPTHLGPDVDVAMRLRVAIDAAVQAGRGAMDRFASPSLKVERKHDGTLVTQADREAELVARQVIAASFSDDAVHGEEFGESAGTSGYGWLIDPIDGTISFANGVPLWGTLIAVTRRDPVGGLESVVAGVIHMPAMGGETVFAAAGGGAWHVPAEMSAVTRSQQIQPASVSTIIDPADGILLVTGVELVGGRRRDAGVASLVERFGVVRGWSDCYAHLLIATGRAEVCIEPMVSAWDIGPALVIVPEAGGACSTLEGELLPKQSPYLVTNGFLHQAAMLLVRLA